MLAKKAYKTDEGHNKRKAPGECARTKDGREQGRKRKIGADVCAGPYLRGSVVLHKDEDSKDVSGPPIVEEQKGNKMPATSKNKLFLLR